MFSRRRTNHQPSPKWNINNLLNWSHIFLIRKDIAGGIQTRTIDSLLLHIVQKNVSFPINHFQLFSTDYSALPSDPLQYRKYVYTKPNEWFALTWRSINLPCLKERLYAAHMRYCALGLVWTIHHFDWVSSAQWVYKFLLNCELASYNCEIG